MNGALDGPSGWGCGKRGDGRATGGGDAGVTALLDALP
jgi:hypothetical protein